jgi:hypothetical protein
MPADATASGQAADTEPTTISILGLEDTERGRPDRWSLKRPDEWRLGRAEVPLDVFRERVHGFLESMKDVISGVPERFGEYQLHEVTVSAEVSAKGQVSLLGSGGEIAGKAGLTFTFVRESAPRAERSSAEDLGNCAGPDVRGRCERRQAAGRPTAEAKPARLS